MGFFPDETLIGWGKNRLLTTKYFRFGLEKSLLEFLRERAYGFPALRNSTKRGEASEDISAMENDGLKQGTIYIEIRGTVFNLNNLEVLKSRLQTKVGILADDLKMETDRFGNFGSIIKISGRLKSLDALQSLWSFLRQKLSDTFDTSILKIEIKYIETER